MGQCNAAPSCPRRKRKNIIILLVGLDNAGKTCTAKCLLREPRENIAPTVGFSIIKPKVSKHNVTIYDLGGGQRIRGIWKCYFAEAHGLIYVVDASDSGRFDECKEALNELIGNPNISGKPVLLLANKQDCENAADEIDIVEALGVENIVNKFKSRTKIETCSSTAYKGKRFDRAIAKGFQWLVDTIAIDYAVLSARIEQDMEAQRKVQEKEQAERLERIRILREQREKENPQVDDVADGNENVNPFRPINEIADKLETSANGDHDLKEMNNHEQYVSGDTVQLNDAEVRPPLINGFMKTAKEPVSPESHEVEASTTVNKTKKRKRLGRNNKTAPAPLDVSQKDSKKESMKLPPLQLRPTGLATTTITTIADSNERPLSGVKHSWGLAEELEPVDTEHAQPPG